LVTAFQLSDVVVFVVVDVGVVNALVVEAGDTVNVTGIEALPPLSTLILTVVV
jgi:hypothetical protein